MAGLFGGTFPMLIAYSVELSSPDVDLVKYRQTMLVTVLMVSPVLMSPIGGGVARFGLVIPFIIAFGTASLGLLFVIFNMKDVADVKRAEARLEERGGDEEEEEAKQKNHEKLVQLEGSPFKDPVFLILSFGYMYARAKRSEREGGFDDCEKAGSVISAMHTYPQTPLSLNPPSLPNSSMRRCLMAAVGSLVLFYSFTFTQESFGLTVAANATTGVLSEAQVTFNQEQVAAAVGIIPLPGSICMCLSMTYASSHSCGKQARRLTRTDFRSQGRISHRLQAHGRPLLHLGRRRLRGLRVRVAQPRLEAVARQRHGQHAGHRSGAHVVRAPPCMRIAQFRFRANSFLRSSAAA